MQLWRESQSEEGGGGFANHLVGLQLREIDQRPLESWKKRRQTTPRIAFSSIFVKGTVALMVMPPAVCVRQASATLLAIHAREHSPSDERRHRASFDSTGSQRLLAQSPKAFVGGLLCKPKSERFERVLAPWRLTLSRRASSSERRDRTSAKLKRSGEGETNQNQICGLWGFQVSSHLETEASKLTFATAITCRPRPRPLEAPSIIPGRSSTAF